MLLNLVQPENLQFLAIVYNLHRIVKGNLLAPTALLRFAL